MADGNVKDTPPFDPNDGEVGKALIPSGAAFALGEQPNTIEQYVLAFERLGEQTADPPSLLGKAIELMSKALATPPKMFSYARAAYMPDPQNKGVLQWPGIAPEAIRKIVAENIAPQLIIGQRVDDVLRYATLSSHPWRPGWHFELMDPKAHPSRQDLKDMREAEEFLQNSNIETGYAAPLKRDEAQTPDFQGFLSGLVRDTLTFDGIAIWTRRDSNGRVKQYSLLPAGNIRLVDPRMGYLEDKSIYAVAVDEAGSVIHTFKREEVIWYRRNVRTDPFVGPYGYPEPEMAMKLIQGYQNAVDLNLDAFNRSAIPNGILTLLGGGWNQKQVDVLSRVWNNLKRGVSKSWALPVIAPPKDGKLEILDLQNLKDKDVRYQDFMNMVAAGFCLIYRFPPRRFGYRTSGKGPDAEPLPDKTTQELADADDPGLPVLLGHVENVINPYIIWSRWPHLKLVFTGKNPKEDAREYEAKRNAQTWKEARAEADLPELTKLFKDKKKSDMAKANGADDAEAEDEDDPGLEELARIMEMCPIDPNLSGVFQTIAGAYVKTKFGGGEDGARDADQPGNRMTSKKDPAKSEEHGATSGVRRNSRAEGARRNGAKQ